MSGWVNLAYLRTAIFSLLLIFLCEAAWSKTALPPEEYVNFIAARTIELKQASRAYDQIFSELSAYEVDLKTAEQLNFVVSRIGPIFTEVLSFARALILKDDESRIVGLKFLMDYAGVENIPYQGLVRVTTSPTLDMLEQIARNPKIEIAVRRDVIRAAHVINGGEYLEINLNPVSESDKVAALSWL